MKRCGKCKNEKELNDFGKWAAGRDGLCLYCRDCVSKDRKDYLKKNRENLLVRRKELRKINPERFKKSYKKSY